jgi:excisionase family DNA binding protein
MTRGRTTEATVREAARLLGTRLDSTYRLVWERRLTARKDTTGRWLISAASIEAYKHSAKRRRNGLTRKALGTPAFVAAGIAAPGAS